MHRLFQSLTLSIALMFVLTACITGDDDDNDSDSPGSALGTVVSGIGSVDEDEGEEHESDDDSESEEADAHDTASGVTWTGDGKSSSGDYEICFIVSDDASMLTVSNDGCDDFSIVVEAEVDNTEGSDCELDLETTKDIPIENGSFEVSGGGLTVKGSFGSDAEASGTIEGECTVSWEARPES